MLHALAKCDWLGVAIAMAWGCCVILFTQWGGVTKSWKDGSVIACAVMTFVIPFIFFGWEYYLGDNAMFKLALIRRRTIAYVFHILAAHTTDRQGSIGCPILLIRDVHV
jgi:hypothetical protein